MSLPVAALQLLHTFIPFCLQLNAISSWNSYVLPRLLLIRQLPMRQASATYRLSPCNTFHCFFLLPCCFVHSLFYCKKDWYQDGMAAMCMYVCYTCTHSLSFSLCPLSHTHKQLIVMCLWETEYLYIVLTNEESVFPEGRIQGTEEHHRHRFSFLTAVSLYFRSLERVPKQKFCHFYFTNFLGGLREQVYDLLNLPQSHIWAVNKPVKYSEGFGFRSRPGGLLSCIKGFVVFLSLFSQITQKAHKLGYDRFFIFFFIFFIHNFHCKFTMQLKKHS